MEVIRAAQTQLWTIIQWGGRCRAINRGLLTNNVKGDDGKGQLKAQDDLRKYL